MQAPARREREPRHHLPRCGGWLFQFPLPPGEGQGEGLARRGRRDAYRNMLHLTRAVVPLPLPHPPEVMQGSVPGSNVLGRSRRSKVVLPVHLVVPVPAVFAMLATTTTPMMVVLPDVSSKPPAATLP